MNPLNLYVRKLIAIKLYAGLYLAKHSPENLLGFICRSTINPAEVLGAFCFLFKSFPGRKSGYSTKSVEILYLSVGFLRFYFKECTLS